MLSGYVLRPARLMVSISEIPDTSGKSIYSAGLLVYKGYW
jgi:hypothetical protein